MNDEQMDCPSDEDISVAIDHLDTARGFPDSIIEHLAHCDNCRQVVATHLAMSGEMVRRTTIDRFLSTILIVVAISYTLWWAWTVWS